MSRPTIKDVAREAGVSASTVSRALADSSAISDTTKERVALAAKKLGYTPNTAARCLRSETSGIIGIVLPDISGEFYAACASAVFHTAREYGYAVLIADTEKTSGFGTDSIQTLLERQADGIIFIGGGNDDDIIYATAQKGVPVVTGDRSISGIPSVTFNNRETVSGLVKALYNDGCRSFAYVSEPADVCGNLMERYMGYTEGVRACPGASGVEIIDKRMDVDKLRAGYDICREYFAGEQRPEAVITSNDLIAQGIISAADELGISVPGDMAVAGFDDARASAYWIPPLTTVRQEAEVLARECFIKLYALIKNEEVENTVLRQKVIVRSSMLISKESFCKESVFYERTCK